MNGYTCLINRNATDGIGKEAAIELAKKETMQKSDILLEETKGDKKVLDECCKTDKKCC